jgi:hypothetical protein
MFPYVKRLKHFQQLVKILMFTPPKPESVLLNLLREHRNGLFLFGSL